MRSHFSQVTTQVTSSTCWQIPRDGYRLCTQWDLGSNLYSSAYRWEHLEILVPLKVKMQMTAKPALEGLWDSNDRTQCRVRNTGSDTREASPSSWSEYVVTQSRRGHRKGSFNFLSLEQFSMNFEMSDITMNTYWAPTTAQKDSRVRARELVSCLWKLT